MYNFKRTSLIVLSQRLNEIDNQKKMLAMEEKAILLELKDRFNMELRPSSSEIDTPRELIKNQGERKHGR